MKKIIFPLLIVLLSIITVISYYYIFSREQQKNNQINNISNSRINTSNENQSLSENPVPPPLPEPKISPEKSPITILAFGDLMLDRYVRKSIDSNTPNFPFKPLEKILEGNDIVVVNLEGSFTDFAPKPLHPNNLSFTFDPSIVPTLKNIGINVYSLANNHSLNFGQKGLAQSQEYLKNNQLEYFGHPLNSDQLSLVKEVKGTKIGFVGYHSLINSNFDKVAKEIKTIRPQVDFLIVYPHWGAEYQTKFGNLQQREGRQFIDAGADVIIGSHPHVVQPFEVYNNKVIFYSLGNFLFDQTFSQKTQEGLGVKITLNTSTIEYELIPTEIKNIQIHPADQQKSKVILKDLASNSLTSEETKDQIKNGKIIIKR